MKRIFAFILSFILIFGSGVTAEAFQARPRDEALTAGYHLSEVIELIMTRYLGDSITVDMLFEAAIRGMTDELDEFSTYFTAAELSMFTDSLAGRIIGIGITMVLSDDGMVEISRVLPGSPAEGVGVLPGDFLLTVDGEDVTGMPFDSIAAIITDPNEEWVTITVQRQGRVHTFTIQKAEIRNPTVVLERFENMEETSGITGLHNFRYVQINSVGLTTGDDVRQVISIMQSEGVEGIILDLRGNAGGYLDVTIDIANQLVPQGVVLQTINQAGRRRTYSSVLSEMPFDNVVVLVNRFTASAAEVIASALQDSGAAVIVGEPTFGKGLVQSLYLMRTGGGLRITTEEYFRRNGGTINNIGVMPCILVERHGSAEGLDPVLRRGLDILLGM